MYTMINDDDNCPLCEAGVKLVHDDHARLHIDGVPQDKYLRVTSTFLDKVRTALEKLDESDEDVAERIKATTGGLPMGEIFVFGSGNGGYSSYARQIDYHSTTKLAAMLTSAVAEGDYTIGVDNVPKEKARQLRRNVLGKKKGRWS